MQRYLNDEPVLACPPSTLYRFRKFARRNKAVLATASAVALAVLVAVGSFIGAVRVLANSNAQIPDEQKQTKQALERETQAKEDALQALYFQRIASAEREQATNNAGWAEELLDECPFRLRGWEWHYLKRRRYQPPLVFRGHGHGQEQFVLRGHRHVVYGVTFSPDGKRLATASGSPSKGEITIWGATRRQPKKP